MTWVPLYTTDLLMANGLQVSIYSGIYIFCLIWPFRQRQIVGVHGIDTDLFITKDF